MTKNNNGVIRDTIAAIDFIRTARSQAPPENEIIKNMLLDNEKILLEQLFQLSKQDRAPLKSEQQQLRIKGKSKGKEVSENGDDSRRSD